MQEIPIKEEAVQAIQQRMDLINQYKHLAACLELELKAFIQNTHAINMVKDVEIDTQKRVLRHGITPTEQPN